MSNLEERLRSWFASEVDRAERDLATSRASIVRVHGRSPIPGLALAGLLVALVVVAVALRPSAAPDSGKGPHRSPATTTTSADQTVYGSDGIPTMLEGQKVLTPEEATAHARSETTDRPFLVGGWFRSWPTGFGCQASADSWTDWRVLERQDGCGFSSIEARERRDGDTKGALAAVEAGTALEVVAGEREWGRLVARVHIHDPRAADCPERSRAECEAMAVIDTVLWRPPTYANGIPREIAGEPVVLVDEAYGPLTRPGSPQRMLVGGWYTDNPMPCPSQPGAEVSPLLPRCNGAQLSETLEPGGLTIAVVPDGTNIPRGRVVLRVHTGDARASSCPESARDACEKAIVVDEIVWREPVAPIAGRFPDGIPNQIAGEAVFRVANLSDAPVASFLLGGWAPGPPWGCGIVVVRPPGAEGTEDLCPLGQGFIADGPTSAGIWTTGSFDPGPVIVRVHRGPDCSGRLGCGLRPEFVVEQVLWAGDEATNTQPLRITDVVTALERDIAGFAVEVDRPSRTCDPGWPDISWVPTSGSGVTNILVFPTIADREAVDQNFRSSGWTGIDGCSVATYGDPWHWVAVDNVMISTTEALADRTRIRLEGIAP